MQTIEWKLNYEFIKFEVKDAHLILLLLENPTHSTFGENFEKKDLTLARQHIINNVCFILGRETKQSNT
jgi:hypothetical protein